jgi:hypothetical protein
MKLDQQFWAIVQDLRWKLDDGTTGTYPGGEPEFYHGGPDVGRRLNIRAWSTTSSRSASASSLWASPS